jgi:hypothetical protein
VTNPRSLLDTEVYCPLSGMKFGALPALPVHKVALTVCVNGALYAECKDHRVRMFVRDRSIVSEIMKTSHVVGVVTPAKQGGRV